MALIQRGLRDPQTAGGMRGLPTRLTRRYTVSPRSNPPKSVLTLSSTIKFWRCRRPLPRSLRHRIHHQYGLHNALKRPQVPRVIEVSKYASKMRLWKAKLTVPIRCSFTLYTGVFREPRTAGGMRGVPRAKDSAGQVCFTCGPTTLVDHFAS